MKVYYLFLSLASIVSIGLAQSTAEILAKRYDLAAEAICGNKQITDDQLAEMTNKCKCSDDEQINTVVKTCLKITELSARQRLTVFCDKSAKECLVKDKANNLEKGKPDAIAEWSKAFDLYLACVKTILKV